MHISIYSYIYLKLAIHCQTLKIANETSRVEFGIVIFFLYNYMYVCKLFRQTCFFVSAVKACGCFGVVFLKKKHLPIKEYFQTLTV